MPQKLYWITAARPFRIAIVARPRGNDWLAEEIEGLSRDGINTLVSMLTADEAAELGIDRGREILQRERHSLF